MQMQKNYCNKEKFCKKGTYTVVSAAADFMKYSKRQNFASLQASTSEGNVCITGGTKVVHILKV